MSPRLSGYSVQLFFYLDSTVPAFVISQVARKWSLAVDPMHRAVLAYSNRALYKVKV
jgi:hypothetical protein